MTARHADLSAAYAAARTGAIVVDRSHEGRLRAVGRDRLDLLHRMSTNDLNSLLAGEARRTVLTTAIGRMVDVLCVLNRGETVLCLTGEGRAQAVRKWLSGYIFYNDKVKFEDVSNDLAQLGVYGPRAGAVVNTVANGAEALAENRFVERDHVIVLRGHPFGSLGFTVLAPRDQLAAVWDQVAVAGAIPAGEDTYQALRLAAGVPGAGREINEEYIPLEANLWSAVSFTKGCYIGQEIIARMESRGKLARRLVGLRLDAPVSEGVEVRVGDTAVGTVTSAGIIPDIGPVALAYLRSVHAEADTRVSVGEVGGVVAELPLA